MPVALLQVRDDGGGAGLVAVSVEILAQGDDLVLDRLRGAARAGSRAS
jgi:hypothetical protein